MATLTGQHGGRIGAEFNEVGTTFWVELPALGAGTPRLAKKAQIHRDGRDRN